MFAFLVKFVFNDCLFMNMFFLIDFCNTSSLNCFCQWVFVNRKFHIFHANSFFFDNMHQKHKVDNLFSSSSSRIKKSFQTCFNASFSFLAQIYVHQRMFVEINLMSLFVFVISSNICIIIVTFRRVWENSDCWNLSVVFRVSRFYSMHVSIVSTKTFTILKIVSNFFFRFFTRFIWFTNRKMKHSFHAKNCRNYVSYNLQNQ